MFPYWILGVGLAVVASATMTIGLNFQKLSHQRLSAQGNEDKPIYKARVWQFGFLLFFLGNVFNTLALMFAKISIVAPLGSVSLLVNTASAPCMLGERFNLKDAMGICIIAVGTILSIVAGPKSDTSYSLDTLLGLFTRTPFLVFAGCTIGLLLVLLLVTSKAEHTVYRHGGLESTDSRARAWIRILPVCYASIGALIGSYCVLFAKSSMELVKSSFRGSNQFGYPLTYVIIAATLLAAIGQIQWINKGLAHFDALIFNPMYFAAYTLFSITAGALYFGDFSGESDMDIIFFSAGLMLVITGVYLLTQHPASLPPTPLPPPRQFKYGLPVRVPTIVRLKAKASVKSAVKRLTWWGQLLHPSSWPSRVRLGCLLLFYVITGVGSTIYYRLALNTLIDYAFVASEANLLLTSTGFAVLLVADRWLVSRCRADTSVGRPQHHPAPMSPDEAGVGVGRERNSPGQKHEYVSINDSGGARDDVTTHSRTLAERSDRVEDQSENAMTLGAVDQRALLQDTAADATVAADDQLSWRSDDERAITPSDPEEIPYHPPSHNPRALLQQSDQSSLLGDAENGGRPLDPGAAVQSSAPVRVRSRNKLWGYVIMVAMLDVVANLFQIMGADGMGPHSGTALVVLSQGVIPLTMVFSWLLLRIRYTNAGIVVAGVLVAFAPQVAHYLHSTQPLIFTIVFFLANFPVVLNQIAKEFIFRESWKDTRVTVLWLGCWERIFELPMSVAAMPSYFAVSSSPSHVPTGVGFLTEMWRSVRDGTICLILGKSIEAPHSDTVPLQVAPSPFNPSSGSDCAHALSTVVLFNVWSLAWLVAGLAVVRDGGANLCIFANTIAMPVSAMLFASSLVVGPSAASDPTWWQIASIIILTIGTGLYAMAREKSPASNRLPRDRMQGS